MDPIIHRNKNIEIVRNIISCIWIIMLTLVIIVFNMLNSMLIPVIGQYAAFTIALIRGIVLLITVTDLILDIWQNYKAPDKVHMFNIAICFAVIAVVYVASYTHFTRPDTLIIWTTILFAVTAFRWDEDKVLRIGLYVGMIAVIIFYFLSMIGLLENNRGNSFGFSYRTHYACFLLYMMAAFCVLKDGRHTWLEELGLVAVTFFNLFFVGGKAALVCMVLLDFATFLRHYRDLGSVPFQDREKYGLVIPILFKILYIPVVLVERIIAAFRITKRSREIIIMLLKYSFIVCAILVLTLSLSYRALSSVWTEVAGGSTFVARLVLACIGFEEYPFTLFGSDVPLSGNSGQEGIVALYYALDSAFPKILIQYGLLAFIIIIALMTVIQIRLSNNKRYYAMFVIALLAIDCIMEYWLFNLSYNLVILLASCKLVQKPGIEACDKSWIATQSVALKRVVMAAICLLCATFMVWSVTAYHISNWRGRTPEYDMTVVLPGDYIDIVNNDAVRKERLNCAFYYLKTHQNTPCITSTDLRDFLVSQGIEEKRIYVDDRSDNVDSLLANAFKIIEKNDLPPRLTVCTFDIQQAYIQDRASELHIPVNGLTMKPPMSQYLLCFSAEQWRLLKS